MRIFLAITAVFLLAWGVFLGIKLHQRSRGDLIVYQTTELTGLVGSSPAIKPRLSLATFSPNGTLFAGANARLIYVWKTKGNDLVHVLTPHAARVKVLRFSPNGKMLLSLAEDGDVRLFDIAKAEQIKVFMPDLGSPETRQQTRLLDVAFSPGGEWIAGYHANAEVSIWDALSGQKRDAFYTGTSKEKNTRGTLFFMDKGQHLFISDLQGRAQVFDLETHRVLYSLEFVPDFQMEQVSSFQWAPTNQILAMGMGKVALWDVQQSKQPHVIKVTYAEQPIFVKSTLVQMSNWFAMGGVGPQLVLQKGQEIKRVDLPDAFFGESILAIYLASVEHRLHVITDRHHVSWAFRGQRQWLLP